MTSSDFVIVILSISFYIFFRLLQNKQLFAMTKYFLHIFSYLRNIGEFLNISVLHP